MINFKKYFSWFIFVGFAAVCMQLITYTIFNSDENKAKVDEFLTSNVELSNIVGEIHSLKLKKKVAVAQSNQDSSYTLYYYLVNGANKNIRLSIRVDEGKCEFGTDDFNKKPHLCFTIISIE